MVFVSFRFELENSIYQNKSGNQNNFIPALSVPVRLRIKLLQSFLSNSLSKGMNFVCQSMRSYL